MGWRIVPLFMIYVGLAHFNRISISVAGAEIILPQKLLNEEQMGLVYSTFLFLYMLAMVPAGWFIDRRGPYAGWILLGIGSALGSLMTGFVGHVWAGTALFLYSLLIFRGLMGSTNAPLHPAAARLVENWVPSKSRGLGNGLVTFAAMVGVACTYIVFGKLIDLLGWINAFLATGAITAVITIIWWQIGGDAPLGSVIRSAKSESLHREWFSLLANRNLICLTLSYGCMGYIQYLFFYWVQYYFESVLKLSKDASRENTSLLILTMGVGMVLGGWLADRAIAKLGPRFGSITVPVIGLLLGAAATVAGAFITDAGMIVCCFAVAMGGIGLSEAAYWMVVVSIHRHRGGTAAAIMNTGGNAIGLLAPVMAPVLASHFGWQAVLYMASGVCTLAAGLWLGVKVISPTNDA
ncbi:MFS transporter [soil metagenome]